jgi:hypothetical protein
MAADHVGCRPGLVDKDKAGRIEVELAIEPVAALLQDVRAVLFDSVPGLFSASCRGA